MPPPLSLTDDELDCVMSAAQPLDPDRRPEFLQAVADELSRCPELGPGSVFRAVREVQRQFWTPPSLARSTPAARRLLANGE